MNKRSLSLIFLLLFTAVMTLNAFAADSALAVISFTVENTPGTVVIDALDGAPSPDVVRFENVTEGKFELSFTAPGDYSYRIYQIKGDEANVTYDDTVYNAVVSVFYDGDGSLYAVVTLSVDGDAHKPADVVFTNTVSGSDTDPGTGTDTDPGDDTDPDPAPGDDTDPDSAPGDDTDPGSADVPTTGDDSRLGLWWVLIALSMIGIMGVCLLSKEKTEN